MDWGAPRHRFRMYSQQLFQVFHDLTARTVEADDVVEAQAGEDVDYSGKGSALSKSKSKIKKSIPIHVPVKVVALYQFCLSGGF